MEEQKYTMRVSFQDVIDRLQDMENHFLFVYKGKNCGIDPLSRNHYKIWYGAKSVSAKSFEEAIASKIWDGNRLIDIFNDIEIDAY